jgi:hypothetical protein
MDASTLSSAKCTGGLQSLQPVKRGRTSNSGQNWILPHPIGTTSVAGGLRTEARMEVDVPGNGGQESGAEPVRSEWWRGASCLRSRGGSQLEVQC